ALGHRSRASASTQPSHCQWRQDFIELHLSHSPPVSPCPKKSRGSAIPTNPRSSQPRFLRLNQRIMQSKRGLNRDAGRLLDNDRHTRESTPHGRQPSRLSTIRGDQAPRIYVHPNGRCADVVFADAHCVKRTLRAYAEQPLRVRGREIIVFRKYMKRGGIGQ
ncbi:hypothetical protein F5888DRAFT_1705465, partial [Russula emetica]